MTTFFRFLKVDDKDEALKHSIGKLSHGDVTKNVYHTDPSEFFDIPGAPFAYWVSSEVRACFNKFDKIESEERTARQGLATSDDFRFIRTSWEISGKHWPLFAKGGDYSLYYYDLHLKVNWQNNGAQIKALICKKYPYLKGNWEFVVKNTSYYLRPGLTWPRRTQKGLGMRLMPEGCIIADKGPAIYCKTNNPIELLALQAIVASCAFRYLINLQISFGSFEVGVIGRTPIPSLSPLDMNFLAERTKEIWALKRTLDKVIETSHVFILPELILNRIIKFESVLVLNTKINTIQKQIDDYCFELYQYSFDDRLLASEQLEELLSIEDENISNSSEKSKNTQLTKNVLSWAVGVVFGRYDWRLAKGTESQLFEDPEPFDPLPEKSPGMLVDDTVVYHHHEGILCCDNGHNHDLQMLITKVLIDVDVFTDIDISLWLEKDFFTHHLMQYSKSRRQAPIYWPLQTPSGSFTLWIYYNQLNEQSLYICINNFIDPKLKQVNNDLLAIQNKTNRSSQEENELEKLINFEIELKNFRDELLGIAQFWTINFNDGVQITAAPLWKLFQHKAWQKKLKKTWEELEKGKYDWAHLAYSIWPERVLKKCHKDHSFAIAHDVEAELWEEVGVPEKSGKRTKLVWQPKELSDAELDAYIQKKIAEN